MHRFTAMRIEQTQILTRGELARVLQHCKQAAERTANAWRNLIIVRLACCCGLRVSEIGGLRVEDVVVGVARPHLRLRQGTKGGRLRSVPLWWDAGRPLPSIDSADGIPSFHDDPMGDDPEDALSCRVLPSLFIDFPGTMGLSDSPTTCMSALWLMPSPTDPQPWTLWMSPGSLGFRAEGFQPCQ